MKVNAHFLNYYYFSNFLAVHISSVCASWIIVGSEFMVRLTKQSQDH